MNPIKRIEELKLADGYLLTSEENVAWATEFTGDSSYALVTRKGTIFFTDSRYTLQAQKDVKDARVVETKQQDLYQTIYDAVRDAGVTTLGIEKSRMTVAEFAEMDRVFRMGEYVDISQSLLQLRSMKSEEEIRKIEKAARASEKALEGLLPLIKPGVCELDLRAELLYRMYKLGMDSAFPPIVAGGENSAAPHATPSGYRLRSGDLLTLDFGCKHEGYCSDITRTFAVGNVDEEKKKIYDIVKEAQQRAAAFAQPGCSAREIDAKARGWIEAQGYGRYFGHGTGHGVGREIHELPVVNPRSDATLEQGMVFTVEPGIYVPGIGGVRIEDTLVAGRGSLYTFPKDLIIL